MEKDEDQDIELEEQNDDEEVEEDEQDESSDDSSEDEDWEAEAKKWKAIAQRNKKKTQSKEPLQPKATNPDDEGEDIRGDIASLKLAEQKRQFGYENGLSPEETDAVFKLESSPTEETLKNPFVKGGLEAIRAKSRVANNTPSSSAKSTVLNRKKVKDMTPEERNKAYQEYLKSKGVFK